MKITTVLAAQSNQLQMIGTDKDPGIISDDFPGCFDGKSHLRSYDKTTIW
jgi:hypothetical protein